MEINLQNEDLNGGVEKRPGMAQVGVLYSVVVLLFLVIGGRVQRREFYTGILITEFVLILLPVLIFLFVYKYDVKKVLRLNRISFLNIFLIFWITVFAIPVAGIFNLANLWLVRHIFGKVIVVQPPAAVDLKGLILSILVIGGAAGICEEVLFRGVIQRSYERFGYVRSILITALLFGLIHIDFQKLFGTFFLGALIGFIVYRTNSLYGGIFAHFTNNSLAVLLVYVSNKFSDIARSSGMGGADGQYDADQFFSMFEKMSSVQMAAFIIGWAFVILFCASVLTGLVIAFIRTTSDRVHRIPVETGRIRITEVLWFLPGLLLIGMKYFDVGTALLGIDTAAGVFLKFFGL